MGSLAPLAGRPGSLDSSGYISLLLALELALGTSYPMLWKVLEGWLETPLEPLGVAGRGAWWG